MQPLGFNNDVCNVRDQSTRHDVGCRDGCGCGHGSLCRVLRTGGCIDHAVDDASITSRGGDPCGIVHSQRGYGEGCGVDSTPWRQRQRRQLGGRDEDCGWTVSISAHPCMGAAQDTLRATMQCTGAMRGYEDGEIRGGEDVVCEQPNERIRADADGGSICTRSIAAAPP